MSRTSCKRRRLLILTWCIRRGIRVQEITEYLRQMGYNERGNKLRVPRAGDVGG